MDEAAFEDKIIFVHVQNGVKIQIWSALITYVLIHIIKSRLVPEIDIFDIYRRVQNPFFNKIDLYELLANNSVRKKVVDQCRQLELNYA